MRNFDFLFQPVANLWIYVSFWPILRMALFGLRWKRVSCPLDIDVPCPGCRGFVQEFRNYQPYGVELM